MSDQPRVSRLSRTGSRRAAFAVAVIAFGWMAMAASRQAYFEWDPGLAHSIQSVSLPGFRTLMESISALGSGWMPFALVTVISVALFAAHHRSEALICAIGVGACSGVNRLIKTVVDRPRPSGDNVQVAIQYEHESFPSGHTVLFVVLFGFLILLTYSLAKGRVIRPPLLALLAILILLIGVSRVHLGAHWPSDVTGGYLLGGIWLGLMAMTYGRFKKPNPQDAAQGSED